MNNKKPDPERQLSPRSVTASVWLYTMGFAVIATALVFFLYYQANNSRELVFRSMVQWQGEEAVHAPGIQQWRLVVPSEFDVHKDNYATTAYDPARVDHGSGYRFVWLGGRIDDDGQIVAGTGDPESNDHITLHLSNGLVEPSKAQSNYCLDEDQRGKLRAGTGCAPHRKSCNVHLNFHGWPVKVGVNKSSLYKDPQKVCEIARDTLQSWTMSIDDLRANPSP